NEIVAELVACRIFDQAAEMEFRSDMKKHFTLFKKLCDKRAAVVIDKCYKEDEKLALRLLKALDFDELLVSFDRKITFKSTIF
ncbi:unnamed protein product, partial [Didymodactylos carnosus]